MISVRSKGSEGNGKPREAKRRVTRRQLYWLQWYALSPSAMKKDSLVYSTSTLPHFIDTKSISFSILKLRIILFSRAFPLLPPLSQLCLSSIHSSRGTSTYWLNIRKVDW